MNIEELINKHHKILGGMYLECGPGWYDLIDKLCTNIQRHIDAGNFEQIHASQVKEKFGGLRFYIGYGDEYIMDIVEKAEDMSYNTCEECGSTDASQTATSGWISTLCEKCIGDKK